MQFTALQCLSQALEVEVSTYPQIRRAGIHIPAAAAWMLHAAPQIWEFCNSKELSEGGLEQRCWIGGSDGGKCLWNGDEGFSVERWMFWKQRFEVVGELGRKGFAGRVVDGVIGSARQAGEMMQRVEHEDGSALGVTSRLFERDDTASSE